MADRAAAGYTPIEDYGIIGDLHTVALVGTHGSIDFLSFPRFDSPTIFAALLDRTKGGRFAITPCLERHTEKQIYLPDTSILITRFLSEAGVAEVARCGVGLLERPQIVQAADPPGGDDRPAGGPAHSGNVPPAASRSSPRA